MNREILRVIQPERTSPERLSPEGFEKIGFRCFYEANAERKKLGAKGGKPAEPIDYAPLLQKNGEPVTFTDKDLKFGESPIRVDVVAEKAVLGVLAESNIRWHVRSEEHGEVFINNGNIYAEKPDDFEAEAFAVLDGIDGSKPDEARISGNLDLIKLNEQDTGLHMKEKEKLSKRAGTMLSFAPKSNPSFKDFTFAGMLEHEFGNHANNKGRLVYATQGRGVFVQTPNESRRILPPTNPKERLGAGDTISYLELQYFGNKKRDGRAFEAYLHHNGILAAKLLSSGSHHIDFILGESMPDYATLQTSRSLRFGDVAGYDIPHRRGAKDIHEQQGHKVYDRIGAVVESERKGYEEFVVAETFMRILYEQAVSEGKPVGVVQTFDDDGNIVNLGDLNYNECVKRWYERPHEQLRPIVVAHSPSVAKQLLTMK